MKAWVGRLWPAVNAEVEAGIGQGGTGVGSLEAVGSTTGGYFSLSPVKFCRGVGVGRAHACAAFKSVKNSPKIGDVVGELTPAKRHCPVAAVMDLNCPARRPPTGLPSSTAPGAVMSTKTTW